MTERQVSKRVVVVTVLVLLGGICAMAGIGELIGRHNYDQAFNQCYEDLYKNKARPTEACSMLTDEDLSTAEAGVALEKMYKEDPELRWLVEEYGQ